MLVAHQREVRFRRRLRAHDVFGALEFFVRRQRGRARRWPQQLPQRDTQAGHHHAHHRAQRARRMGIELELPPQLVGVIDAAIDEEQQEHRRGHHPHHRDQPHAAQRMREQRRAAIELRARHIQQNRQHDEITGLRSARSPSASPGSPRRSPARTHAHHAASSRCNKPRAMTIIAKPVTLPMKCDASTSVSGTCSASMSIGFAPRPASRPTRATSRRR